MPDLTGKRMVLLGGTSGLGLSAAARFVADGAHLVIVGRDDAWLAAAQSRFGPTAIVLAGEATRSATADLAVQRCVQAYGGLDGLYHIAGGSGRRFGDGPIHALTDAGWDETLRLNLTSVAWSNRAAIRQFLAQQTPGVILNLASVLAWSPSPLHFDTTAYAAAKAGVIGLSRALAARYARDNIRVNVLAPGLVDTPMAQRAAADPRIRQYTQAKQPLDGGRIGQPGDLDGAATFLLSDAARFITGQVIAVDGGWTVSEAAVPTAPE